MSLLQIIYGFLHEWQTLVSGVIALTGALLAVGAMEKQNKELKNQFSFTLDKERHYWRACLSDAIVDVSEYLKECYIAIEEKEKINKKPDSAMNVFKENIKYADELTSKNLFETVTFYQVFNSRYKSYIDSKLNYKNKIDIIFDLLKLNHYFMSFFKYARNEVEAVENLTVNYDDIASSLRSIIGVDNFYKKTVRYNALLEEFEKIGKFE